MGRLTVRDFENEACCTHGGCIAYEDCYECPGFQNILAKLAHYEELEEAGRLVELPCAVGDTVYGIFCDKVYPKKITRIEINPHTNPKLWIGTKFDFSSGTIDRIDMVLGKTVFLTLEEAEAALKGAE